LACFDSEAIFHLLGRSILSMWPFGLQSTIL
jgi:hypothetical protein